jgi:TRAP-type mannitol/chloroaromatic compound transport system permease small subunit
MTALAAYIIRAAFWAVLFIGVTDAAISFLRVENLLTGVVGAELAKDLGRSVFRGSYVHYPLILVAMVVAIFARSLGFTWLALLIVIAELLIVILRFIYSYEQTFLGDLVRFWYAGLFLFASAYTLIQEGHVRVDILFTSFSERGKAWSNVIGTMLFGIPVCWIILTRGLWTKTSSINAPLLSFEVTQSGFGMYVKYLMAGFLLVYALSMLIQFCGYFLGNAGVLLKDGGEPVAEPSGQHSQ